MRLVEEEEKRIRDAEVVASIGWWDEEIERLEALLSDLEVSLSKS